LKLNHLVLNCAPVPLALAGACSETEICKSNGHNHSGRVLAPCHSQVLAEVVSDFTTLLEPADRGHGCADWKATRRRPLFFEKVDFFFISWQVGAQKGLYIHTPKGYACHMLLVFYAKYYSPDCTFVPVVSQIRNVCDESERKRP
jgi:hypothetical protein